MTIYMPCKDCVKINDDSYYCHSLRSQYLWKTMHKIEILEQPKWMGLIGVATV
jgi:hypothetical protein